MQAITDRGWAPAAEPTPAGVWFTGVLTVARSLNQSTISCEFPVEPGTTRGDIYLWLRRELARAYANPGLFDGVTLFLSIEQRDVL